jgi:Fur family zinc uptake transcriptional regulator
MLYYFKKNTKMDTCSSHQHCVESALKQAEAICDSSGSRLTSIRKRVLELVWAKHEPMKAYDLLSELQKEDTSAKPPTIYRALDFLLEHGLIHKIHRFNAYVGCIDPDEDSPCLFLICKNCDNVSESHDKSYYQLIDKLSKQYDFIPVETTFEIEGLCSQCSKH